MQARQKGVLKALNRVQSYLDAHRDALGDVATGNARANLDDAVRQIEDLAHRQDPTQIRGGMHGGRVETLRTGVRQRWMMPIAQIARAFRVTSDVKELRKLRMPPRSIDAVGFAVSADEMRTAASRYEELFIKAGMPVDFLEGFGKAIDALDESIEVKDRFRGERRGATTELATQISRGLAAIRVINSLIRPILAGQVGLLADWDFTRRTAARASKLAETADIPDSADVVDGDEVITIDRAAA